jgi:hypothetical protein
LFGRVVFTLENRSAPAVQGPREEEPRIIAPMIESSFQMPGASACQAPFQ